MVSIEERKIIGCIADKYNRYIGWFEKNINNDAEYWLGYSSMLALLLEDLGCTIEKDIATVKVFYNGEIIYNRPRF